MPFRFQSEKVHCTFKGHIDHHEVYDMFKTFGDIVTSSIVHELGDEDEDGPTPYAHTHAFIRWRKRLDTTNPRCFDIEVDGSVVHPNIQTRRGGSQWMFHICMKYHIGHKTKNGGKKYFKAPEGLWQTGVEEYKLQETIFDAVAMAPDFKSAVEEAGVSIKSMSDVALVRRMMGKRKFAEMDDESSKELCKVIEWDRSKALIVKGFSGMGKTNWAIAQFERPALISNVDDLKSIPEDADGLVFDEILFDGLKKDQKVFLLDMKFARTVKLRYFNATIPKGIGRIFCCNEMEYPFGFEDEQSSEPIRRRFTRLAWDGATPLYLETA